MEWVLGEFAPGFELDIRKMGANHGLTDHERKHLILREDVNEGACDGLGRDRGTYAHEIFHAIVHRPARLARRMGEAELEAFRNSVTRAAALSAIRTSRSIHSLN